MSDKSPILRWKMIACDLDGTLLGRNHKVHELDLAALRNARAAGIHVAIATGRSAAESAGVIGALDLQGPGIFANGAMVAEMSTGKTIARQTIPFELANDATDFFGSRGHAVLVLTDHPESRLPTYFLTDHGPPHRATTEWLLLNKTHAEVRGDVPPDFRNTICRLGIVVDTTHAAGILEALESPFHGRAYWHSIYSPYFDCQVIEFFALHTSKWTGILAAAELLRIPPTTVVTIGDDINDIAMLENATLSFAMGNAAPAIQARARLITLKQQDAGVAHAIEKVLMDYQYNA